MIAALPLLLTTFAYMLVDGVESLFHPIVPGVMICVAPSDVIISASTPEPGSGSVVIVLLASAVLLPASV